MVGNLGVAEKNGDELTEIIHKNSGLFPVFRALADKSTSASQGRSTTGAEESTTMPHALYPLVDQELERWTREGIAKPVDTNNSSGWATPLVVVPKADGKVRLAADYRMT